MKKDVLKLALICVDILITLIAIVGLIWFFFIKGITAQLTACAFAAHSLASFPSFCTNFA